MNIGVAPFANSHEIPRAICAAMLQLNNVMPHKNFTSSTCETSSFTSSCSLSFSEHLQMMPPHREPFTAAHLFNAILRKYSQ
jgi:hypothetical protein